ncbi:MAG TPA: TonB-dependent receptor [Hyphomonadaceae bacterium]|nr:TonB-dependent receptor [Hyphomonadaceae bacterium]
MSSLFSSGERRMVDAMSTVSRKTALLSGAALASVMTAGPALAQQTPVEDLRRLSIEQLANLEVTTASRRPEALGHTAAAVDVITGDDIREAGVQSLPEALRLARNLEVARVSSQHYAISARGFNSFQASTKLLVLVDGRSVYTPLYSGVFWDQQIAFLEDIDRIEVISGPGGTLWGANAVNGVINVISRSSQETQGAFAQLWAGDVDQRLDLRYGGRMGENGPAYRIFATGFERGSMLTSTGEERGDEWSAGQLGFRSDWGSGADRFMAQGGYFQRFDEEDGESSGGHFLGRWRRELGDGSRLEAQAYYASASAAVGGVSDELQTWDIDLQHAFRAGAHDIVWGGGYRVSDSEFINTTNPSVLDPARRTLHTSNLFVQDEIALGDDLALTLGLKAEDHTYTGVEYMPNIRLALDLGDDSLLWAAVSRAVRTPSRIDRDLVNPGVIFQGGIDSEVLLAYELGYRTRPTSASSVSANLYYHDYEGVRTVNLTPPGVLPAAYGNGLNGPVYGLELWGDVDINPDWRLSAGVTLMKSDLEAEPLAIDLNGSGLDPDYQVFLRSHAELAPNWTLDLDLRAIDEVHPQVPSYVELGARLAWRVNNVEIALVGANLLDESHPESINGQPPPLEARRSVQLMSSARF